MNPNETIGVATVSVGLPQGLDPEAVRARKGALIAAGTEPLLAESLAITAEEQQAMRDAHLKPVVSVKEVAVTVPVAVVTTEPDADNKKAEKKGGK